MEQVLFQRDGVPGNVVILLAKLTPVAVQVERGNLAEVIPAVCEGQNNVLPLLVLRNSRCDVIEFAGRGSVLNVAEQAVLEDCLGSVRREYACLMARLKVRVGLGTADEKLDLCKEENICTLMKNGLER